MPNPCRAEEEEEEEYFQLCNMCLKINILLTVLKYVWFSIQIFLYTVSIKYLNNLAINVFNKIF